jgi:tetratricopeptide (TPR) repeat protein
MGFVNAIGWKPGPILLHQTFGNILDELGDHDEALKHRLIAIQMDETSWNFDAYGNTLSYLERYQEAEAAYRKSLSIKESAATYYNLGLIIKDPKRSLEAEDIYRKCLSIDPTYYRAQVMLAKMLHQQGRDFEARQLFRSATDQKRKNLWPLKEYEDFLNAIGETSAAAEIHQRRLSQMSGADRAP